MMHDSKVYCIGDSHISFFSGKDSIQPSWPTVSQDLLPWFKTFHIGPALAFNLSREGTQTQGREKIFDILKKHIPCGATLLLSFGEIDCRMHLTKQAEQRQEPLSGVVGNCLDEYFKIISEMIDLGYRIIVYNAVPSHSKSRKLRRAGTHAYASYGTKEQRTHAIRLFNAGAKERSAKVGAYFLENAHHLTNSAGKPYNWYFFDSIHLSQRAMPATLHELAILLPDLNLKGPPISTLNFNLRLRDWLHRRYLRIRKELSKLRRK